MRFIFLPALLLAAQAQAVTVDIASGDGWHEFFFADSGAVWTDIGDEPLEFRFSLSAPAELRVVDAGLSGDRFEVFDGGASLGPTSAPIDAGAESKVDDFDAAFGDPRWSRGVLTLNAGMHLITGLAIASPLGGGIGALQVAPIPVPAAAWLLVTGLAGIATRMTRRAARTSLNSEELT